MTPWVTRLIVANLAMFLVSAINPIVFRLFLLVPVLIPIRPWTLITYMFLHAGPMHLLFNMLALYFFGPRLELRLGSRQFLWLYFLSGLMGAILSVITPTAAIVGASGAVFGVLLGYARYWPRDVIYIWGILPIEARWLVVIMTGLSLYGGVGGGRGGIAHFAHLGGFLGAFLYLKWRERTSPAARFRAQATATPLRSTGKSQADVERWRAILKENIHPVNREEVDRLLQKIEAAGVATLTADEKAFLDRFSE